MIKNKWDEKIHSKKDKCEWQNECCEPEPQCCKSIQVNECGYRGEQAQRSAYERKLAKQRHKAISEETKQRRLEITQKEQELYETLEKQEKAARAARLKEEKEKIEKRFSEGKEKREKIYSIAQNLAKEEKAMREARKKRVHSPKETSAPQIPLPQPLSMSPKADSPKVLLAKSPPPKVTSSPSLSDQSATEKSASPIPLPTIHEEKAKAKNSVLQSKLQSKIDALSIMSKELDKCSMERDRYKVLVEQLKSKKASSSKSTSSPDNFNRFAPTKTISGGEMLAKTREQNNMLKVEVETLRSELEEATKDKVALRKQLQKKKTQDEWNSARKTMSVSNKDYEKLVQQLEKVQKKYQQLQLDNRATLDEKKELVADCDYYKSKVQRLNTQISSILSKRAKPQQDSDSNRDPHKPIVDIDALITENKYLHERITQLQAEKEIIKRTLTKYKTLLDNRTKNETDNLKKGFKDVMTQKQVQEFLDNNCKTGLKGASAAELKPLCLGLCEALNDKSIALQHQRKTNQILANRITELEKTLDSWCNGQKYIPVFPSQMLLDEFLPDSGSAKSDELKAKNDDKRMIENAKEKYADSDDDNKEKSDKSSDIRSTDDGCKKCNDKGLTAKTVLPYELEQLVKEARAELKLG